MFLEIGVDGVDQFADAGEAAVAHDILGEVLEEPLDRFIHELDVGVKCRTTQSMPCALRLRWLCQAI